MSTLSTLSTEQYTSMPYLRAYGLFIFQCVSEYASEIQYEWSAEPFQGSSIIWVPHVQCKGIFIRMEVRSNSMKCPEWLCNSIVSRTQESDLTDWNMVFAYKL